MQPKPTRHEREASKNRPESDATRSVPAPPAPADHPNVKSSIAVRRRYRQSRRKSNLLGYAVALSSVLVLAVVVQFKIAARSSNQRPDASMPVEPDRIENPPEPSSRTVRGRSSDADIVKPSGPTANADLLAAKSRQMDSARSNSTEHPPGSTNAFVRPDDATHDRQYFKQSSAQRSRYKQLMLAARKAINRRDAAETDRLLKTARELAQDEKSLAQVKRLELLADYVSVFWEAFDESLADLEGVELVLDDKPLFVRSANRQRLVIRTEGLTKEISVTDLPPAMVLAIADRKFDQSAASTKVFKGAYMAVEPAYGVERAAEIWAEAATEVPIDDLPLVLTDSYD